ncbi:MAG: PAS domain-containing protein [Salinigranum sp.]
MLANRIDNAVRHYRAERAAESTETRLSELAENSDDILWMFSGDWEDLLFVNSAYEDTWGRSVESLRSDPSDFLDGIHPADRPRVREAMDRLSSGESVDIEYRVNEAQGYRRWVWVQGQPIVAEDGSVVRIAGFARDVTERRERERVLARYRTLVETVGDPMYVLDTDGRVEVANRAMVEALGTDREAILGREIREFLPAEDYERASDLVRKLATEVTVVTTDDERIPPRSTSPSSGTTLGRSGGASESSGTSRRGRNANGNSNGVGVGSRPSSTVRTRSSACCRPTGPSSR